MSFGVPIGGFPSPPDTSPSIAEETFRGVTGVYQGVKRVGGEILQEAGKEVVDLARQTARGLGELTNEAIEATGLDTLLDEGWTMSSFRDLMQAGLEDADIAGLITGGVEFFGKMSLSSARAALEAVPGLARFMWNTGSTVARGAWRVGSAAIEDPQVREAMWNGLVDAIDSRASAKVESLYARAAEFLDVPVAEVRDYVESGGLLADMPVYGAQGIAVGGLAAAFGASWDRMLGREPADDDDDNDPLVNQPVSDDPIGLGVDPSIDVPMDDGTGNPPDLPMPVSAGDGNRLPDQGPPKRPRPPGESPFGDSMDIDIPGAPSRKRPGDSGGWGDRERGRRRIDYGA